ncbi:hypothetical protein B0H12DRAFT_1232169 [Mycena haematopus]|nr:hypothetical protein B0H12DRAFT_1232169 [Mycena haematopus]
MAKVRMYRLVMIVDEIAALESQSRIAAIVELRDRECAVGAALRFIIAPIRTLPVELLAEIFVLTIHYSNELEPIQNSLHLRDAFRVSQVCCHWRQIAHGLPPLWTGPIKVEFSRPPDSEEEIYANGLRALLTRSDRLSVHISMTGLEWTRSGEIGPRLPEELLRVASRWRSLRFLEEAPASLVLRLAGGSLEALEELQLQKLHRDVADFDPTALLSFTTAPRLRILTIDHDLDCRIPMPWTQLTDIVFTNALSPHVLFDVLAQCTNVVRAAVTTTGGSLLPVHMLALDHLQILQVTFVRYMTRYQGPPFLDLLSAPSLCDLQLFLDLAAR